MCEPLPPPPAQPLRLLLRRRLRVNQIAGADAGLVDAFAWAYARARDCVCARAIDLGADDGGDGCGGGIRLGMDVKNLYYLRVKVIFEG